MPLSVCDSTCPLQHAALFGSPAHNPQSHGVRSRQEGPRHSGSGAEGILGQIRSATGTYLLFALLQVAVWIKMQ